MFWIWAAKVTKALTSVLEKQWKDPEKEREQTRNEWIAEEEKELVFATYQWDGWTPRKGIIGKTTEDGKFSCPCCEWANFKPETDFLSTGIVHFWINWCKPPGIEEKIFFPKAWLELRTFCERRQGCHLSAVV